MAVYKIQAPDGSILRIEGPDDATEDEILAFAETQFTARPKPSAEAMKAPEPGVSDPFGTGGAEIMAAAAPAAPKEPAGKFGGSAADEKAALDYAQRQAEQYLKKNPKDQAGAQQVYKARATEQLQDAVLRRQLATKNDSISLGDIGPLLGLGSASLVKGVGELTGSETLTQAGQSAADFYNPMLSEAAQNPINPIAGTQRSIVESLPGTAVGGGVGGLLARGGAAALGATQFGRAAELAGAIAGREAPLAARATLAAPAVVGGALGEGAAGAAAGAASAAEEFDNLKPAELKASPRYQELLDSGLNQKEARAALRGEFIRRSALQQGAATAAIGALVPGVETRIAGSLAGRGISTGEGIALQALKTGGKETGQEFLQGGAEQIAANEAKQALIDPTQSLTEDALVNASKSALAGAATGAVFGGAAGLSDKLAELRAPSPTEAAGLTPLVQAAPAAEPAAPIPTPAGPVAAAGLTPLVPATPVVPRTSAADLLAKTEQADASNVNALLAVDSGTAGGGPVDATPGVVAQPLGGVPGVVSAEPRAGGLPGQPTSALPSGSVAPTAAVDTVGTINPVAPKPASAVVQPLPVTPEQTAETVKILRDNDITAVADPRPDTPEQEDARRVAAALGRPLVKFIAGTDKAGGLPPDGVFVAPNGTIALSGRTTDAPLAVVTHETVHSLDEDVKEALLEAVAPTLINRDKFQVTFGYGLTAQENATLFAPQDDGSAADVTVALARFKQMQAAKAGQKLTPAQQVAEARRLRVVDALIVEEMTTMITQEESKTAAFWQQIAAKMGDNAFGRFAQKLVSTIDKIIAGYQPRPGADQWTNNLPLVRDAITTALATQAKRVQEKTNETTPAAQPQTVPRSSPVRGSDGGVASPSGPDQRDARREKDGSLKGLPRNFTVGDKQVTASVWQPAVDVAKRYAEQSGIAYNPPFDYVKVDKQRAERIAQEYTAMRHDPQNAEVKAAYDAMIAETTAQYQAILDSGLTVEFIDYAKQGDPYAASPRLMTEDVRNNNHMWVFSTRDGFGSSDLDVSDNPLLAETGFEISGKPALANDLFRVVHDYFGHVKEGVGFRADGEENAWRAHSAMYSPLARRAMTSETRGQNSWVNFGPNGEANRTASGSDTVYADQKVGLLPEWVSEDGAPPAVKASKPMIGIHYGKAAGLSTLSSTSYGTGIKGAEAARLAESTDARIKKRVYFYIKNSDAIPAPEAGLGPNVYEAKLENIADTDNQADLDRIRAVKQGTDTNAFESAVLDAGFDGYSNRLQGTIVVLNKDVPVKSLGNQRELTLAQRAPSAAPAASTSRTEGNERVRRPQGNEVMDVIRLQRENPNVRMEFGEARVPLDQVADVNARLTEMGSTLQFSMPEMRISPRAPTAVRADEDVMGETRLQPDLATLRRDPAKLATQVNLLQQYPNFRGVTGTVDQRVEAMLDQMTGNLVWLYNQSSPEFIERTKQWYVGGNEISRRWADRYGLEPQQVAAVIAANSPQKDWFQNLSIAERVLEAVVFESDVVWTPEMTRSAQSKSWASKKPAGTLQSWEGRTLRDLFNPQDIGSLVDMAKFIRAMDEIRNPQTARITTPEGVFLDAYPLTAKGAPTLLIHQNFGAMAKSLMLLSSQGADPAFISANLGKNHKVRSFYNNIIAPSDSQDVTIDTHAVAAALLRPLGAASIEVEHNFGGGGAGGSAVTGLYGTYALYAEAYRRAAAQVGVLPREMQSVTWEAVRGLFRPEQKRNAALLSETTRLWENTIKGSEDETRQAIGELAGGIEDPSWVRSADGANEAPADSTYRDELRTAGATRPEARATDGGRDGASATGTDEGLTFSRPMQTDTASFKQWFGDSKVVDENGEPLVVYHGGSNIDVFDASMTADGVFYFTEDRAGAREYAELRGKKGITAVYLRIENDGSARFKEMQRDRATWKGYRDAYDRLKAEGFDGVISEGDEIIAFYPEQIKSAIGNNGDFDPNNPDIRRARPSQQYGNQLIGGMRFTLPTEGTTMKVRRALQDYFLRMQVVQDAVLSGGGTITEAQDVYRAEERSYGRMEEQLKDFQMLSLEPLLKDLARSKIEMDELALYAYAIHAPEANAAIAAINPGLPDGGSGMTDAEAAAVLAQAQAEGKTADLERLHAQLMTMTDNTRRILLDEGLISQDEFDAWTGKFQNYVPLKGLAAGGPEGRPGTPTGRGFNIRGKESLRRLGRSSRATDIVENIIKDFERAVVRAERNQVARTFLDLALTNPDPTLWEVAPKKTTRSYDKATGQVTTAIVDDTGPDTVSVKLNGKEVYVKVKDELLLRALRKASTDETGAVSRFLNATIGKYTTFMRNTLTRYNPVFGAVNAVRDGQYGMAATYEVLGGEGARRFAANYAKAVAAATRYERGALDANTNPTDRYFQEYRAAGATTGGFSARDVEEISDDLRRMLVAAGAKPRNAIERIRASKAADAGRLALRSLEVIGSISENAARFAAYSAAREMGKTPAEAASIAKNLTTNFNRKGEWGSAMNSAYLFFNAAVQGSTRTIQMMASPRGQKLLAGVVGFATGLAAMNAFVGGDDEDGQSNWDKIPAFEKERNLIFMIPPGVDIPGIEQIGKNGRYFKVPMAYGLNVFAVMGNTISDMFRYSKNANTGVSYGKGAVRVASAAFGAFNPFGGAVDLTNTAEVAQAIAPSILDLGIQATLGVDAFGRPTSPQKSPFDQRPDSEMFTPGQAGGYALWVARKLNAITGGNAARPGAIDLSAGDVQNLVRNLTGGTGSFLADVSLNIPAKLMSNEELTYRDIPLVKNFFGRVDATTSVGLAYERRNAIQKEERARLAANKQDIKETYDAEQRMLQDLAASADRFTTQMSRLRKEEIAFAEKPDTSAGALRAKRKELQLERAKIAQELNAEYVKALAKKNAGKYDK